MKNKPRTKRHEPIENCVPSQISLPASEAIRCLGPRRDADRCIGPEDEFVWDEGDRQGATIWLSDADLRKSVICPQLEHFVVD